MANVKKILKVISYGNYDLMWVVKNISAKKIVIMFPCITTVFCLLLVAETTHGSVLTEMEKPGKTTLTWLSLMWLYHSVWISKASMLLLVHIALALIQHNCIFSLQKITLWKKSGNKNNIQWWTTGNS